MSWIVPIASVLQILLLLYVATIDVATRLIRNEICLALALLGGASQLASPMLIAQSLIVAAISPPNPPLRVSSQLGRPEPRLPARALKSRARPADRGDPGRKSPLRGPRRPFQPHFRGADEAPYGCEPVRWPVDAFWSLVSRRCPAGLDP